MAYIFLNLLKLIKENPKWKIEKSNLLSLYNTKN